MNNIQKQLLKFDFPNNLNTSRTPIILTDSKGKYLRNQVHFNNNIVWCCHPKISIQEHLQFLKGNLDSFIQQHGNITLFIWLGTCDLTKKDKHGFISLRSKDNSTVNTIYSIFKDIYFYVKNFEKVKLVFIELPVYSIYWWNFYRHHSNAEQFRADDILLHQQVCLLNSYIRDVNRLLHVHSPDFSADLIQTRKQSTRRHTFKTYTFVTYSDGIHPGKLLSKLWLCKLCRLIRKYC